MRKIIIAAILICAVIGVSLVLNRDKLKAETNLPSSSTSDVVSQPPKNTLDAATIYTNTTKLTIDAHNLSDLEDLAKFKYLEELEIKNYFSGYFNELYYLLEEIPLKRLVIINTEDEPINLKSSMVAICRTIPNVVIASREINVIEDNFITDFSDIKDKSKIIEVYTNSFIDDKNFFNKAKTEGNTINFNDYKHPII